MSCPIWVRHECTAHFRESMQTYRTIEIARPPKWSYRPKLRRCRCSIKKRTMAINYKGWQFKEIKIMRTLAKGGFFHCMANWEQVWLESSLEAKSWRQNKPSMRGINHRYKWFWFSFNNAGWGLFKKDIMKMLSEFHSKNKIINWTWPSLWSKGTWPNWAKVL